MLEMVMLTAVEHRVTRDREYAVAPARVRPALAPGDAGAGGKGIRGRRDRQGGRTILW